MLPGLPEPSVNHRFPSAADVMSIGRLICEGTSYSVIRQPVVILPIRPESLAYQRLPSGPAAIPCDAPPLAMKYSLILPVDGTILAMRLAKNSVNHTFPSGPDVMPRRDESLVGVWNLVMTPAGVMRPIWSSPCSVNQRFPSGPATIKVGN